MVVPDLQLRIAKITDWPSWLSRTFSAAMTMGTPNAVMGHYTALISDLITDPIVALVRDPDQHFESSVAFFSDKIGERLHRDSIGAVLQLPRLNNPQMRSLSGVDVPAFKPADGAEIQRCIALVDDVVDRFRLFRVEDYPQFLSYCENEYGVPLMEYKAKPRRRHEEAAAILDALRPSRDDDDPVWLDRLLYERVAGLA